MPPPRQITDGPHNLGLLWSSANIKDPQVCYCASGKRYGGGWTYAYYTVNGPWPFGATDQSDDNVRSGYSYFPQSKTLQNMGPNLFLPEVKPDNSPAASGENYLVPLKTTQADPMKSMAVDLVDFEQHPRHQ
jgi:hypothetical protein